MTSRPSVLSWPIGPTRIVWGWALVGLTMRDEHIQVPSGEHTKSYGKSPFLMGKSTINGHFPLLC